jgi:hypothetical protein
VVLLGVGFVLYVDDDDREVATRELGGTKAVVADGAAMIRRREMTRFIVVAVGILSIC